jgi:glycosyltransferase involved in cell wall biosynthesis
MTMTQQAQPLVSVIIPTYNREKLLKRAIDSVLNQTYKNIEIIVVDDDSTDNTYEVLRDYIERSKVKYIKHENNRGAQAARNTCIKAARGNWIAFLDSDDEWLPQRLEVELSLAHKTGVSVVHSECYIKSGDDNELKIYGISPKSGDIYGDLLKSPGPMFQGLLVKKKCLERIDYLDEAIISYQEWDTAIRLARYYKFGFVEKPLFIYHCHEDETISKDMKRGAEGWAQIIEKNRNDILEVAGRDALQRHYIISAGKYYSTREFEISSRYYSRVSEISTGFWKLKYSLQALLAKKHINPNILNFNRIFRYIFKILFRSRR